jgi:hypothetical protein
MKQTVSLVAALSLLMLAPSPASAAQSCGNVQPPGGAPWPVGDAVLFRTKVLNVDADGAPNSYLVNGNGLSYICDGVVALENGTRVTPDSDPQWQRKCRDAWAGAVASGDYKGVSIFGFLTDKDGRPVVQGEGDPLPGKAFITTTLPIPGTRAGTQGHYVDAVRIPYVVLSGSFSKKYKLAPGTLAVVYRPKTGKFAYAAFADVGKLGEASVALHEALGSQPVVRRGGVDRAKAAIDDPILTVVFPGRVAPPQADTAAWTAQINRDGAAALDAFGGQQKLAKCAGGS